MAEKMTPEDVDRVFSSRGVNRHTNVHVAIALSEDQTVYVLHSKKCLERTGGRFDCEFTDALQWGIEVDDWVEDVPLVCVVNPLSGLLDPVMWVCGSCDVIAVDEPKCPVCLAPSPLA